MYEFVSGALVWIAFIGFFGGRFLYGHGLPGVGGIIFVLGIVNFVLAVFNLLPAFPMDGGRVLRALLGMKLNHLQATHIAVRVGQGMAILIGAAGLFWVGNPFLLLIAAFVWLGATSELRLSQVRASLAGWPVSRAMVARISRSIMSSPPRI